jgi:hypothetical protein
MARIRTIKPEFPHSESMGRVSRDARLCFIMLWTIADDSGRLRGNSRMLASLLFPYDDDAKKHIDAWLDQLSNEGCIVRYEIEGDNYIQVLNWSQHQKIDRPSASKIPEPNEASRKLANVREASLLDQGRDQGKDQGGEGKGKDLCTESQIDSMTPAAVIAIPLNDRSEFHVTQEFFDEWVAAYPAVDVMQQLRNMRQWCMVNPSKRKTRQGVARFIVGWLSKEQDKPKIQPARPTYQTASDKRKAFADALTGRNREQSPDIIDI